MSLGNQEAPRSIHASRTSFREDLVMKIFLRPFFVFRCIKKSICQLMAKRWALSTGNLPRGGLPRNSVDRITDCLDMTSAVDRGRKALTQTNKTKINEKLGCVSPYLGKFLLESRILMCSQSTILWRNVETYPKIIIK